MVEHLPDLELWDFPLWILFIVRLEGMEGIFRRGSKKI
jgi:hypothetical protein